jgi:hypothetical protein
MEPCNGAQERGFAGAVRADDAYHLAGVHGEAQGSHGFELPMADG